MLHRYTTIYCLHWCGIPYLFHPLQNDTPIHHYILLALMLHPAFVHTPYKMIHQYIYCLHYVPYLSHTLKIIHQYTTIYCFHQCGILLSFPSLTKWYTNTPLYTAALMWHPLSFPPLTKWYTNTLLYTACIVVASCFRSHPLQNDTPIHHYILLALMLHPAFVHTPYKMIHQYTNTYCLHWCGIPYLSHPLQNDTPIHHYKLIALMLHPAFVHTPYKMIHRYTTIYCLYWCVIPYLSHTLQNDTPIHHYILLALMCRPPSLLSLTKWYTNTPLYITCMKSCPIFFTSIIP